MAADPVTKKFQEIEKKLKAMDARIKALADTMTSSKDIDKYVGVLQKNMSSEQKNSENALKREMHLKDKAVKALWKESNKENAKNMKAFDKMTKDAVKSAEIQMILTRLAVVENLAQAALAKK